MCYHSGIKKHKYTWFSIWNTCNLIERKNIEVKKINSIDYLHLIRQMLRIASAIGSQKLTVSSKGKRDWRGPCGRWWEAPISGLKIGPNVLILFISTLTFFGTSGTAAPHCYSAHAPILSHYLPCVPVANQSQSIVASHITVKLLENHP